MEMPPYASNFAKDFIPGKTQVLYSGPYWDEREINLAMEAFLTGKWITSGEYVARFQGRFAQRFNVKHAHMVNSGSSANLVMLAALKKAWGWEDGEEVIVSPVGFPTTIAPIVQNRLKPVFVDIELETLNFDVDKVESKLTDNTAAIFVSPVLGNPPDVDILRCFGSVLVGDNCDSLGSKWDGKLLNEVYCAWSTSFYPAHHISTGEGGMICSDDKGIIDTARSLSWWGRDCHCVGQANLLPCGTCGKRFDKWIEDLDEIVDHKYVFENMGWNLKPLDLQGAIGIAQLEKFTKIDKLRRYNKERIAQNFLGNPHVRVASQHAKADPSWFGVPLICETPEIKKSLVEHFEKHLIQTRPYFAGNILNHPGYKHLGDAKQFPNANRVMSTVFFIGCPPHYTEEILNYISEVVKKWKVN